MKEEATCGAATGATGRDGVPMDGVTEVTVRSNEELRCGEAIRVMERGGGGAPAACGSTAAGRIQ